MIRDLRRAHGVEVALLAFGLCLLANSSAVASRSFLDSAAVVSRSFFGGDFNDDVINANKREWIESYRTLSM